jgi:hypothetical protein
MVRSLRFFGKNSKMVWSRLLTTCLTDRWSEFFFADPKCLIEMARGMHGNCSHSIISRTSLGPRREGSRTVVLMILILFASKLN